jgi:hypothetical protein
MALRSEAVRHCRSIEFAISVTCLFRLLRHLARSNEESRRKGH